MSLFDFFRGGAPSETQIQKVTRKAIQTAGEDGPRLDAIEKLAEWGTPAALGGLLRRFTVSSKVLTQDIEEKRMVVRLLAAKGNDAVDPILGFMRRNHQVDWAVEALRQILPEEEVLERLLRLLDDVAKDEFSAPQHRVSLIRALEGQAKSEHRSHFEPLLDDIDDEVRVAAAELLAGLGEDSREPLLEGFVRSADRPRVRLRIVELLADHGWAATGYKPTLEENLPEGFTMTAKGVVKRR